MDTEEGSQSSRRHSTPSAGWPSVAFQSTFFSPRHGFTYSLYVKKDILLVSLGKDCPSHPHRREAALVTHQVPGPSGG